MILDQIAKLDKVLILGYAREGQSTSNFLRSKFPELIIVLADRKQPDLIPTDKNIITCFGQDYLNSLKIENCKLVIKTPGISPHKPEIVAAKKAGITFTSHMQIFFEVCPSKNTIGVTGTKGKSTTVSLIYAVLRAASLPTVLVGNIGQPALDYLSDISPQTWVVMELSSYQLMDLTVSPRIAVLQNIYPDHLDYHRNFAEYQNAKLNITKFQTETDFLITQTVIPTRAKKIIFSLTDFPPDIKTKLIGNHNKLNIIPSLKIAQILELEMNSVYKAIADFTPLATRLELVGTKNGIQFYADTLATIPEATIAAIDALSPPEMPQCGMDGEKPDKVRQGYPTQSVGIHSGVTTLIAGGYERKQNYLELAKKILDSNIKTLILFPATGPRIAQQVNELTNQPINIFNANSMPQAVKLALGSTASGAICLLSPAAPSFTLFKDYQDEYDQYKQAINSL